MVCRQPLRIFAGASFNGGNERSGVGFAAVGSRTVDVGVGGEEVRAVANEIKGTLQFVIGEGAIRLDDNRVGTPHTVAVVSRIKFASRSSVISGRSPII